MMRKQVILDSTYFFTRRSFVYFACFENFVYFLFLSEYLIFTQLIDEAIELETENFNEAKSYKWTWRSARKTFYATKTIK